MRIVPIVTATTVFLAPGVTAQQPIPTWALQPELRIGSVDDGPYALLGIRHIVVSPRTGAVFLTQADEVRVFSAEGRYLRSIGRRGSGPGEFMGLNGLGWSGELLVALDVFAAGAGRASLFTEEGAHVETRRITGDPSGWGGRGHPRAPLAGGYYLWEYAVGFETFPPGQRVSLPLVRTNGDGDDLILDHLMRGPIWRINTPQGATIGPQPLMSESLFAADPKGETIVIVHQDPPSSATNAFFRVRKLTANGQAVFARTYRFEPRDVPQAYAESIIRDRVARMQTLFPMPRLESTIREAIRPPRFQPPVTSLRVAADGSVWLRREDVHVDWVTWWILNVAGDLVGQLQLPRRLGILHIDADTVWGVDYDDLDVPYAVRYRIRR